MYVAGSFVNKLAKLPELQVTVNLKMGQNLRDNTESFYRAGHAAPSYPLHVLLLTEHRTLLLSPVTLLYS